MENCKPCHTPLPSSIKFSAFGSSVFHNLKLYRSVVGSLQYLTVTHPELSYCVSRQSQFVHTPLDDHWKLVKRVLRYVSGTSGFGLHLHRTSIHSISAYSDSDWEGDPDDRKSTGGFCAFLERNLVSWSSKKQGAVARSSIEAEYRAMTDLVAELIWIKNLMVELRIPLQTSPSIYCDNLSAVLLFKSLAIGGCVDKITAKCCLSRIKNKIDSRRPGAIQTPSVKLKEEDSKRKVNSEQCERAMDKDSGSNSRSHDSKLTNEPNESDKSRAPEGKLISRGHD
ncbi:uncharacterized mitochondrial protein AtMg00810-like [Arachis stenosperma]|uniref:uncharacterized mitochondrial protein AtMg00810-like n=1 Tax=Arachis stenosperma TaxID=217475 RepID=UPI0025ABD633|nr:uncharacterized mitochondrial protein AtMg00810-like [Arachis stenosperma]